MFIISIPGTSTLNVKVAEPTSLVAVTMYVPKSIGIKEIRCRVDITGGVLRDGLVVIVTLSPSVRMLPE